MTLNIRHSIYLLSVMLLSMFSAACSSAHRQIRYAEREWHISSHYGQIIDKDTTYRMTFGEVLIPIDLAIISCADSASKYPGMDKFLAEILATAGLQDDEVLFYSPTHGKIFVKLTNDPPTKRPSSITSPMNDDRRYTMWLYDDDVEEWKRNPSEMYTYTYFDLKRQRVLVVDYYHYGEIPIAEIFVIQSRNKTTDKMQLLTQKQLWDFSHHNLKQFRRDIEFWSFMVNAHRDNSVANYLIGQEMQSNSRSTP